VGGNLSNFWVYLAGPFTGGLSGAFLFTVLHLERSVSLDGSRGGGGEAMPISTYTTLDDYKGSQLGYGIGGGTYGAMSPVKGAPVSPKQAFI